MLRISWSRETKLARTRYASVFFVSIHVSTSLSLFCYLSRKWNIPQGKYTEYKDESDCNSRVQKMSVQYTCPYWNESSQDKSMWLPMLILVPSSLIRRRMKKRCCCCPTEKNVWTFEGINKISSEEQWSGIRRSTENSLWTWFRWKISNGARTFVLPYLKIVCAIVPNEQVVIGINAGSMLDLMTKDGFVIIKHESLRKQNHVLQEECVLESTESRHWPMMMNGDFRHLDLKPMSSSALYDSKITMRSRN